MASATGWQPLPIGDFDSLASARLAAHHAVQPIASAARSGIAPAPDDSHSSLVWSAGDGALMSQPFPNGRRIGLRIADLTLIATGGEVLSLEDQTLADAGAWVSDRAGVAQDAFAPPPYETPAHPVARGAAFDLSGLGRGLGWLERWFVNAASVFDRLQAPQAPAAAEISTTRCWPHHFDIARLITLDAGGGEDARSVGIGLSPGDETFAVPYLYVSPWPYPDPADLPALAIGDWRTEGFTSAILTAHALGGDAAQADRVEGFLRAAIEASIEALRAAEARPR